LVLDGAVPLLVVGEACNEKEVLLVAQSLRLLQSKEVIVNCEKKKKKKKKKIVVVVGGARGLPGRGAECGRRRCAVELGVGDEAGDRETGEAGKGEEKRGKFNEREERGVGPWDGD
jgi:hypothetical protein